MVGVPMGCLFKRVIGRGEVGPTTRGSILLVEVDCNSDSPATPSNGLPFIASMISVHCVNGGSVAGSGAGCTLAYIHKKIVLFLATEGRAKPVVAAV